MTQEDSLTPTPPAEAPAAAQPDEQDLPGPKCCPQTPGKESGKQIPKGAGETSPLSEQSGDAGAKAKEKHGPAADPATGPSEARTDTGDDAGALGPHPDKGPGAGGPEAGEDCPTEGLGGAEAGRRASLGAQAGSVVLGKWPLPCAHSERVWRVCSGGPPCSFQGEMMQIRGCKTGWRCSCRAEGTAGSPGASLKAPESPPLPSSCMGQGGLVKSRCAKATASFSHPVSQLSSGVGKGWSGAALLPVPVVREVSGVLVPQALVPLPPRDPRSPVTLTS